MRSSILWAITALLLGVSLFGSYKTWDLLKKNTGLEISLDEMTGKLSVAQTSLKKAEQDLSESYLANDKLEGEVVTLRTSLSSRERQVNEQVAQISLLTSKVKETSQVSVSLLDQHNQLSVRLMRLELENAEMKGKLSSVQELKKAIREIKAQKKVQAAEATAKTTVPAEKKRLFGRSRAEDTSQASAAGNEGFFVKDGKSTFQEMVKIHVTPLEPEAF